MPGLHNISDINGWFIDTIDHPLSSPDAYTDL